MKLLILTIAALSFSQLKAQDTLSSFDKNLVLTLGNFLKSQKNSVMGENGLGATFSEVLKNGSKQVLKGTAQKTITDMIGGNNGTDLLQLPFNLKNNKALFLQKGKESMLNNFQTNLNNAGQQALRDGMQIFIGNAFEKLVDNLINVAVSPAGTNTDSLMLAQTKTIKDDYKTNFLPFAQKAMKTYKMAKQAKKISKFLRKNNVPDSEVNVEDMLTNGLWEKVNGNLMQNLKGVTNNPLNLIKGLFGE
jgi:hypothetical protein